MQEIADGLTAIGWSGAGGGGDASLSYGATAPLSPTNGTLWYDTTEEILKLFRVDAWVDINVTQSVINNISAQVALAQTYAQDAQEALAGFTSIVATATTLAPEASATATFNAGTGVLTLGIPKGPQGIQGIAGANGAVMSVAGKIGDVVLTTADIGGLDAALASGGGGFTYMEASNPLVTTNASLNDLWFNTTTMELFICRDATTNENEWEGNNGTNIAPIPQTQASQAYGVEWNQTTDTYTRTGLAVGTANSTSYAGSLQTGMRRCVLNANGTVNYYLHPTDSTKKADGSAAVIDGTAGNVMVEIPKFYYKYEYAAPVHKWSISPVQEVGYMIHPAFVRGGVEKNYRYYCAYEGYNNGGTLKSISGVLPTASQTIATFRTQAQANGTGWSLIDWNLLYAVQMLFLTEYADFDTQAMIGNGNDTGSDYKITTGQSNAIGNASSPATNDDMWMSYRGIENWYASMQKIIDGVNVSERVVYVNSNPATFASDVFTGDYISTGASFSAANGYVSGLNNSSKGFIANAATGTDSTYIPDLAFSNTGARAVIFGGNANGGLQFGGFHVSSNYAASYSAAFIGSGVAF